MNATDQFRDPAKAWAPFVPSAQRPWTLKWAGHLYQRAAFGGTWAELQEALAAGPQRTVDRLLHPTADVAAFNRSFDAYTKEDGESTSTDQARAWWLRRMIETPQPLLEQMTLFWHSFLGISNTEVEHTPSMVRYLATLRRHALGSFTELLDEVIHCPAVLTCLGASAGRKACPPEHIARVLLEQYTVGPGHFSARDVSETARAFAGQFVLNHQLQFIASERDAGVKRILGQEGALDAKGAVRILLEQPATAENVVRRLYRWLVSEAELPSPELIQPLAAGFARNHDIGRLVETMLRSNLFYSVAAYRRKIKSPVEYALSLIRPLQAAAPTLPLGTALAELGQDLFNPPTAKGWAGGQYWINRFTMAGRIRLAQSLFAGAGTLGGKLNPAEAARRCGFSRPDAAVHFLADLWLSGDLPGELLTQLQANAATPKPADDATRLRRLAGLIAALPEFQCG